MSDKLGKIHLITFIYMIIFEIVHFIFYFFFEPTDFSYIIDTLNSSPLYNFRISESYTSCIANEHIIFHVWKGIEERVYDSHSRKYRTIEKGKTEIDKIHGKYFCYEYHNSYKELLYNGQIIKKNEQCKFGYKNCGIIDTLEQELCIPQNENCPLIDVGIGLENDIHKNDPNYIFDDVSNIYYNKEDYNIENKKIIGKIILNDGQPCYNSNQQLWRKFIDEEIDDEILKCSITIFGKSQDDRFINKGNINYMKLYEDNLNLYLYLFIDKRRELESKYLSLYTREFMGIDKTCDEKSDFSEESYMKLKDSQESEKVILIIEPTVILGLFLSILYCLIHGVYCGGYGLVCIFFCFDFVLTFTCSICQIVYLARIINNDLSYDCSDTITNEFFKQQSNNTKKTMIFTIINFTADLIFIVLCILSFINPKCENCDSCYDFLSKLKRCCDCDCECNKRKNKAIIIDIYGSDNFKNKNNEINNKNQKRDVVSTENNKLEIKSKDQIDKVILNDNNFNNVNQNAPNNNNIFYNDTYKKSNSNLNDAPPACS